MRLVVEVSDELHQRLRERAVKEGRPLAAIVREVIEKYLKKGV